MFSKHLEAKLKKKLKKGISKEKEKIIKRAYRDEINKNNKNKSI